MPDDLVRKRDLILVDISAISLMEMAERYPEYLKSNAAVYQDCGFVRESGEKSGQHFAYLAPTQPEFGDKDTWRLATAREAVWVNISRHKHNNTPFFFTGDLRSSSQVTTMYNHLNSPPLVVLIKERGGVMDFCSNYARAISKETNSLWLKPVKSLLL